MKKHISFNPRGQRGERQEWMKTLKMLSILIILLLVPVMAGASELKVIGDIDLDKLVFEKRIDHRRGQGFFVTVIPYPDERINVVQVFWMPVQGGVGILFVRYLKDGDLCIWMGDESGEYSLKEPPTPDSKVAILKDLIFYNKLWNKIKKEQLTKRKSKGV